MKKENSAGGIVLYKNSVLLLKKFNGHYVLPKGKVENNESEVETAQREVYEESGVKTKIIKYLGELHYTYVSNDDNMEKVHKTVYWYLMEGSDKSLVPQREEGFVEAKYIPIRKALNMLRHDDERSILQIAITQIEGE